MKIILLQNVKNLGKIGDIKDVSEGYARNFLIPKKLAEIATKEAIKKIEAQKEKEMNQKIAEFKKLKEIADKLKTKKITILVKEKEGKLFGSITAKNIAEELKKENLNISEKNIIIEEAIKKVGNFEIEIKLSNEIRTKIKLEVKGN